MLYLELTNMSNTEIQYGRKEIDGQLVGYATYTDHLNRKIELLSLPAKGLHVIVDGKIYKPGETVPNCRMHSYGESMFFTPDQMSVNEYVFTWTKVAGWLGAEDLCNQVFRK